MFATELHSHLKKNVGLNPGGASKSIDAEPSKKIPFEMLTVLKVPPEKCYKTTI